MKKNDFPKAGVEEHTLPDDPNAADRDGSNWWSTVGKTGQDPEAAPKKWRTTATDEMEKFKRVPVIGVLPLRMQYMLFSVLLLVSLGVVLFSAARVIEEQKIPDQHIAALDAQKHLVSLIGGLDQVSSGVAESPSLAGLITPLGVSSSKTSPAAATAWAGIKPLLDAAAGGQADSVQVRQSASMARDELAATINAAAPLWRQAGESGQWDNVEAVNFAQAFSELQYLYDASDRAVSNKAPLPARFSTARQNIEQSLRVFASSPTAQTQTPLANAWRALASGFLKARPHLESVIGRSASWNNVVTAREMLLAQQVVLSTPPARLHHDSIWGAALWGSGAMVALCLFLLILISWKQQKWHALEAKAGAEFLEMSIQDVGRQLRPASQGDLTVRIKAPSPGLKTMADMLNNMMANIHGLVRHLKSTAESTSGVAHQTSETTGVLVEANRKHMNDLLENGAHIVSISSSVKNISLLSAEADKVAEETMKAIEVGQSAVEDARTHIQSIREKADEGAARSKRLRQSSSEILYGASLLNEVAEQISVLSIQAALQASKAGEAGQGFRVVADGLKSLAERSGEGARRVSSLIEATISDVQAMEETMEQVTQNTDEGARLSDISLESTISVNQRVAQLQEMVNDIKTISSEQEDVADVLAEKTRQGMESVETSLQQSQNAADAILSLVDTIRALSQSTVKFKV